MKYQPIQESKTEQKNLLVQPPKITKCGRSAELGLTLDSWTDVAVRSENLGTHISLYKMSA